MGFFGWSRRPDFVQGFTGQPAPTRCLRHPPDAYWKDDDAEKIRAADADRWRLQTWLRIGAGDKPKVYQRVFEATEFVRLSYWLEIFFSAGIATFGLVESSPAVIIGAMLISPLMGPIMATGLALAVGDLYLGIKAVLNLFASVSCRSRFRVSWFGCCRFIPPPLKSSLARIPICSIWGLRCCPVWRVRSWFAAEGAMARPRCPESLSR